jgi:2-polyprenyl-6-methoxyphenol hydroxylase-like FAD-dependent oxidoreductase
MKPITIVGGGLAGLTLGIALRQRGVPVTLWEAGHYPRHRVCGEFISGRGRASLQRLGLFDEFVKPGAEPAGDAALFSEHRPFPSKALPEPAWTLSRFILDARLAEHFQHLGGDLRCDARWTGDSAGEGVVRASGRKLPAPGHRPRWFGIKAHATGVSLQAALELHFTPDGYVGLCRLAGEQVNVCGLFRPHASDSPHGARLRQERLKGRPGTLLHARLAQANWDVPSCCAVAGLPLEGQEPNANVSCCIGDAWTMTPPFTGNGMSMAFESAELAGEPLMAYARGELAWEPTRVLIAQKCKTTFAARLRHARLLQTLMQFRPLRQALLPPVARFERLWRFCFWHTR